MPKRSYPFSESFSSQYKVHVGQRELSQHGVFGSKYRQEIYEKTKNLLFNGASAVMDKIWNVDGGEKDTEVQPSLQTGTPPPNPTLLKGQTLIGHDGRLTKSSNAQSHGEPVSATRCGVCQKSQSVDRRAPCSQCDRLACMSCSRQCSNCSSQCCTVCTVVDYSTEFDTIVCWGCSS